MCVGTCIYSMIIGFCYIIHSVFVLIPGENVAITSAPDIDLTCEECMPNSIQSPLNQSLTNCGNLSIEVWWEFESGGTIQFFLSSVTCNSAGPSSGLFVKLGGSLS